MEVSKYTEENITIPEFFNRLLDDDERKKLKPWLVEKLNAKTDTTAIGGRFTYSITPTSLGCVFKVHDCMTNTEINITNYACW